MGDAFEEMYCMAGPFDLQVKWMDGFKEKLRYYFEIVLYVLLPALGYVVGLFLYVWEYGIEGHKPHHVPGLNRRDGA